ncbi:MAG: tripartite tricarboxylate transporter substrate binding protein [Propionibacteriales bacterium]|nr:tripartite tricarboxylate transporter substrate binding protein [Propionibacteriales bacterium]
MRTKLFSALAALTVAAALAGCGSSGTSDESAAEDYPSEELDWTIAFGPGGGNDIMARTMVDILQKQDLYPENIKVENKEGGSGATGWGYLFSNKGEAYNISTTSGSFITTPLQADTGWTHEDFTPVGLFATDDALVLVPGDSPIKNWEDWVEFAKDKGTVTVGGIGTVNVDFILHALLAEAAGYKIDYVPYNEEGQVQTSLLSGALDAMVSNPGSILGQVEAGKMTPLLFTGKEPLPTLPDVPTGESLGFKDLPSLPRGLILPPDAPKYAQEWWIDTMKKVVETDEWKQYLKDNNLIEDVRWGDDFASYLTETADGFEATLKEQGAL